MRIALYNNQEDDRATPLDLEWADLREYLGDVAATPCAPCSEPKKCPHKNRDAWSPVELAACGACRGSGKHRGHECEACKGTGCKTRENANVRAMTCAVIDLDHIPNARFLEILERLEGHSVIIHSTHSHRPPNDGCYRIILELSRPVLESERGVRTFNEFWRGVLATLIDAFGLPADPSCKDLSRLYFLPSIPAGLPSVFLEGEGVAVDVDALLALRDRAGVAADREAPPTVEPDAAEIAALPQVEAIDLESLRDRLKRVRYRKARRAGDHERERYAVLDRILNGEPLAEPGARAAALNQAASIVAYCFPAGTPWEAAREVLRPCIAAMDLESEGGRGIDQALDVTRESYERAIGRRAADDAERVRKAAEIRERLRGVMPTTVPGSPGQVQLSLPIGILPAGADDPALDWRELLLHKPTTANPEALRPCGENVFTILGFEPSVADTICFDLVTKQIIVKGGPFANLPQEVLKVTVTDWLTRYWDLQLPISEVAARILRVARANDFDPLADYLNGLQWDGVDRLTDFLIRYVGARCVNKAGVDITHYVRTIGRRFLISMVARAIRPGIKVDTVLVLEGRQGKRKSMFFEVLGGAWYVSDELVLGDKDSKMIAGRCWLVELAECASMKRTETNSQKAFLSRREDFYRPPYGDNLILTPRRCVFVGSTNDDFWLSDRTGNRRFWPCYCDAIDIAALRRDRDQVWAQAVAEYRAFARYQSEGLEDDANPFRWWLNEDEQSFADLQTRERIQDSALQQKIADWWMGMRPAARPVEFTMLFVAEQVLHISIERITKSIETEIGIAVSMMGFGKRRRMRAGVSGYVYFPTPELRDAAQVVPGSHLASVPTAAAV